MTQEQLRLNAINTSKTAAGCFFLQPVTNGRPISFIVSDSDYFQTLDEAVTIAERRNSADPVRQYNVMLEWRDHEDALVWSHNTGYTWVG